jgi:hypothetical protein
VFKQNVIFSLTLATDGRQTFAMVEMDDTSLLENVSFQVRTFPDLESFL